MLKIILYIFLIILKNKKLVASLIIIIGQIFWFMYFKNYFTSSSSLHDHSSISTFINVDVKEDEGQELLIADTSFFAENDIEFNIHKMFFMEGIALFEVLSESNFTGSFSLKQYLGKSCFNLSKKYCDFILENLLNQGYKIDDDCIKLINHFIADRIEINDTSKKLYKNFKDVYVFNFIRYHPHTFEKEIMHYKKDVTLTKFCTLLDHNQKTGEIEKILEDLKLFKVDKTDFVIFYNEFGKESSSLLRSLSVDIPFLSNHKFLNYLYSHTEIKFPIKGAISVIKKLQFICEHIIQDLRSKCLLQDIMSVDDLNRLDLSVKLSQILIKLKQDEETLLKLNYKLHEPLTTGGFENFTMLLDNFGQILLNSTLEGKNSISFDFIYDIKEMRSIKRYLNFLKNNYIVSKSINDNIIFKKDVNKFFKILSQNKIYDKDYEEVLDIIASIKYKIIVAESRNNFFKKKIFN